MKKNCVCPKNGKFNYFFKVSLYFSTILRVGVLDHNVHIFLFFYFEPSLSLVSQGVILFVSGLVWYNIDWLTLQKSHFVDRESCAKLCQLWLKWYKFGGVRQQQRDEDCLPVGLVGSLVVGEECMRCVHCVLLVVLLQGQRTWAAWKHGQNFL